MRLRRSLWILLCLLLAAGAWLLWRQENRPAQNVSGGQNVAQKKIIQPTLVMLKSPSLKVLPAAMAVKNAAALTATNKFAFRLSNTKKTIGELTGDRHAILLENAFIDTSAPLNLSISKNLQAQGDPGAYVVQARGVIDAAFRATLTAAGAAIVSYIPNDAYLVRASTSVAGALASNPLVQAVIPYEPYYKVQSSLLGMAVEQKPLPGGVALNLGLFSDNAAATEQQLESLGTKIIAVSQSPFGPIVRVLAPPDWTALAQVPGVQIMEVAHPRVIANDLARVTLGISTNTLTSTNYLDLSGAKVMVAVADSGIDASHPDFSATGNAASGPSGSTRVTGLTANDLIDTDGHGTHVAGIIAGNGSMSLNPVNVGAVAEGSVSNADFRGKAPLANLFAMNFNDDDQTLQQAAALTNALISNNSWDYDGDDAYDLEAASYDAATRDALPFTTGSQPVLFVFSAGNDGGGDDDGSGGSADTIDSPATAKNVVTVGALEQLRDITNIVTDANSNSSAVWFPMTDSANQVASYSSRGNVGVGTEGAFGRFKPDVVAPGTFVVSCRSSKWDTNAYYNPTNVSTTIYTGQLVKTNTLNYYNVSVPPTAVSVVITISSNEFSSPFPTNLFIYVKKSDYPTTSSYDFVTSDNMVSIPPDSGGAITGIQSIQNSGFDFAVGDSTNVTAYYDLSVQVFTTNDLGNYYQVLEGMNDSLGGFYRYETGTSMSAAAISGFLALIQDYFTNTLAMTPSPALLKAMLINGSRSIGSYTYEVTNGINLQGWGLANLANSLPLASINASIGTNSPLFFADQSPANALATGDSHTYIVTLATNSFAQYLQLQATLAWTDPPGNPAAAIKLVNNLDLIITNLDTGDVYFGNDISPDVGYNLPWNTNSTPNLDSINNVENIILPPLLASRYSVTVVGREVNVNAVTGQTNNVVQDYALVISCGEGEVTNAITVKDSGVSSNPTGDQDITYVTTTNTPLLNQIVGANTPLLGTNAIPYGATNEQITLGMTNQWHFYVVTNTTTFTNAAFITFAPETLSIPRIGVFANSDANSTRPQADIDLYVAAYPSDPNAADLLNLDPNVISNCVNGFNGDGASLGRGGTEFVAYTNSAQGNVYYIGVKSEDHQAAEYGFIPIFTSTPFGGVNANGDEYVNALNVPINIPDGSPAHPGIAYVFALALQPITMQRVVITNYIYHQNFGDLVGTLTLNGDNPVVLNNHDGLGYVPGTTPLIYDDSAQGDIPNSQSSDGPGNLRTFTGGDGSGVWQLTEVDNALTHTGAVLGVSLFLQKYQNPAIGGGGTNTVAGGTWYYTYLDVPDGITNLQLFATNLPPTSAPPLQLYLRYGSQPDANDYDFETNLVNGVPPGAMISDGPPLFPGRYYIGIFNPDTISHDVYLLATLNGPTLVAQPTDFTTTNGSSAITSEAVSTNTIFVSNTNTISSVNVGMVVQYPRISDLSFTLISPSGQRVLLMENRGGLTATNAGHLNVITNYYPPAIPPAGGAAAQTNILGISANGASANFGTLIIDYDFYTLPDQIDVYYDNVDIFSTYTNGAGTFTIPYGPGISTNIVIVMNQNGNTNGTTQWEYTPRVVYEDYNYLTFTEDTNLTTVPIKFAIPPFDLTSFETNFDLGGFETNPGDYFGPTNIYDASGGWSLPQIIQTNVWLGTNFGSFTNNEVSIVSDPAIAFSGSNFLALAYGVLQRTNSMTPERIYSLTYAYRGPGISGWWRGEGNALDYADPERVGQNGSLIGRFDFPAGEVGQSFEMENNGGEFDFAGTNGYVQIRQQPYTFFISTNGSDTNGIPVQASHLDVGVGPGFSIEGWINPTNVSFEQPLVEWLARVPTNGSDTNLNIVAGPFLDRATGHYYYLLDATNWSTSETWATQIGGHLATVDTADEQNWIFDNFAGYGGTNRNLWIGLTNLNGTNFGYTSGLTNPAYANWITGQPDNSCGTANYTFIYGATNAEPGLWALADNNGITCSLQTNKIYGVVEVNDIQTNGVQFWISITNVPGTTNLLMTNTGCLYADLVDVTNGDHFIFSAPGLVQSNIFQHVALTYDTNSGIANLFYDGTNVATTNFGGIHFIPKTTGDVLLGKDMSRLTNNFYGGLMDEMSIYDRALSDAEIAGIYNVSTHATNGLIGKFDPAITPAQSLAEAQISLGTMTNTLLGLNDTWQAGGFTFTALSNSLPMQLTGLQPGMLFDSFSVGEIPIGDLYYLPEQSLDELNGGDAYGTWTLEIWDNRTDSLVTPTTNVLVSWQLQMILQTNSLPPVPVTPQSPTTITIPPGQIVTLAIAAPDWANFATNILVSASSPLNMFFNQTNPPTGNSPPDYPFLNNVTSGSYVLIATNNPLGQTPTVPPLLPGQTYYLGLQNPGSHAASATIEVDFDITALTNGVPYTSQFQTNQTERYFSFDVSSNAFEATFQLLDLSCNADLVIRKGTPLPTLLSADYGSFNVGNADENIYVLTNSSPVPLSAGTWYVGVIKRDSGVVNYTVLAKELTNNISGPQTTLIQLTNGVPFDFTAGPGAALTNFFYFVVTNTITPTFTNYVGSIHFELYNMTGNGDLTVQSNAPPFAPPFFQSSQNPGTLPEFIQIRTNNALTNLAATWYLGVPDNETNLIHFTIYAVIDTNSVFPGFPGAQGAGAGALGGGSLWTPGGFTNNTVYHVINLNDSGSGSLRDAVSAPNRTIVFDVGGLLFLQSPLVITNSYLTIAGQTAPGGISVNGQMTAVSSAHDVIIRDVAFRAGGGLFNSTNVWFNGFEGMDGTTIYAPNYFAGGWQVDVGNVDVGYLYVPNAYEGTNYLDLDGYHVPGGISTNIATITGQPYRLSFAYSRNPDGPVSGFPNPPSMQVLINSNLLAAVVANITNSHTNLGWQPTSFVFTATSPLTQLAFHSLDPSGDAYGVLLDAINLSPLAATNVNSSDSLELTNVFNVIVDHISAEWSTNEDLSVLNSSNVTVQWSMISDSVNDSNVLHGYGAMVRYGSGAVSLHHNLFADNAYASPRLGDDISLDFVNNVIYDWGTNAGFSANDSADNPNGYTNYLNYVCNYLIASTNSMTNYIAFWVNTNTWLFQSNNFIDNNTNGILDGANTALAMFTNKFVETNQFRIPQPSVDEAYLAYEKVLDFAGPDMDKRDLADSNIVENVRTQTGTIINSAGMLPTPNSFFPYLDTDQDGIPDFWEETFGTDPFTPSPNAAIDASGYTELEEYINWLAGLHALTATNTPVGVDLMQLFGKTGNLSFLATNAVNGSVYLTNVLGSVTNTGIFSNSFAIFTPTNDFGGGTNYGYASFDVWVTNNDTVAYFGPETVSVVVSKVPITYNSNMPPVIINLTNGIAYANTNSGGSDFYHYSDYTVPPVSGVLFEVLNPSGPVTLVARYGLPLPSLSSYDYISANTADEKILVVTNSTPIALTNGDWYLAVVNVSGSNVTYSVEATNLSSVLPPVFYYPTNTTTTNIIETVPFSVTCVATDPNNPQLPLTYSLVSAPTSMTIGSSSGIINWTPTEAQGPSTNSVSVSVGNIYYSVTNTFTIIVEESNTPPFWPTNIPSQTNYVVNALNTFTVMNTATDVDIPANPLTYTLLNPPAGANIDSTNGVITWTPTVAQAGNNYLFTTVVADTNPWAINAQSLSATNNFTVTVLASLSLTNRLAQTNTVSADGIDWFTVDVPTNADWATNILFFATNWPVNLLFTTNYPPTTNGAATLMSNATNGFSLLGTNTAPTNIVDGGVYYLGVQNTNSDTVTFAIEVDFDLETLPAFVISGVTVMTNGNFQLEWNAPTNYQFQIEWTTNLASPVNWTTNANFITSLTTNFIFLDTNAEAATKFYRLLEYP